MSNQAQIKNILAQIADLPFEDQRMVNKLLVASLNASSKERSRDAASNFRLGQIVEFDAGPRKGGITKIKITGFSRDMSMIKGDVVNGFMKWNVSANVCKAI